MPMPVDFSGVRILIEAKTRKNFEALCQNALLISATIVEDAAKKIAPRHVGDYIHHSNVTKISANEFQIRILVKLSDAPDARAWEYGSGLHSTRGPQAKYSIDAKNVPNLVFWWEKEQKWFVGPHVNHPGIPARPYLRPALYDNKDRILLEFLERGQYA